jgi:hypothetical protein
VRTDLDLFLVERAPGTAPTPMSHRTGSPRPRRSSELALLIVAINRWNRIQVGSRAVHPVGEQQAA